MSTLKYSNNTKKRFSIGTTLVELLIALAILGTIAAYTIPKLIIQQQSKQFEAIAKEAAATISSAHTLLGANGTLNSSTEFNNMLEHLNYLGTETSGTLIDDVYLNGTVSCDPASARWCIKLHNGGTIMYFDMNFSGTNTTNAIYFMLDPDGKVTDGGNATGPGKSIQIWLYYNGRISSTANIATNTCNSSGCYSPWGGDPPWFEW